MGERRQGDILPQVLHVMFTLRAAMHFSSPDGNLVHLSIVIPYKRISILW